MSNPLLDDLIGNQPYPEIEMQLPTLGNFYFPEDQIFTEGFDAAKVKVRPLTITNELSIKDPLMVMGRQSTLMLVKALVPEILRPEKMTEIDIIAIILAGRIATYGPKYMVDHICQNPDATAGKLTCEAARELKPHQLKIDMYEHILRYNPYQEWVDAFTVELPEVNQRVVIRPPSYNTFLNRLKIDLEQNQIMNQYKDMEVSQFLTDEATIDAYKGVLAKSTKLGVDQIVDAVFYVESIKNNQTVGDREQIEQWVNALPVRLVERIIDRISKIREDIVNRSLYTYKCDSCGHENRVMVELDVERLFSSGSPETPEPSISKESPKEQPSTAQSAPSLRATRKTATPRSRTFSR